MSKRQRVHLEYWPPSLVRRAAHILGPVSATAKAVAEYDERKAAGQDVHIFKDGAAWVVGPCPSDMLENLGIKVEA